jgi:primosomal protein N'
MSAYTIERKLAAPVACQDCRWHGKTGELRCKGCDRAGTMRCPECSGQRIVWIEAPSTTTLQ